MVDLKKVRKTDLFIVLTGWTPLHFACNNGNSEIAQLLLNADADPTLPDKTGTN